MRLLSDVRKIRKFIDAGVPCPTELIIEHYLACKKEGIEIPKRVDDFMTSCLEEILKKCNQGLKPDFADIFNLKYSKGAKGKRKVTKLNKTLQIGFLVENYMAEGLIYEKALIRIAEERGCGFETVKKLYTAYKKIPDGPDHNPDDPAP